MTEPSETKINDERHPDNALGSFWVNDECIGCDMCYEIAPGFFRQATDGSQAIVFAQPLTESEVENAAEALEECPVQAIQRD